MRFPFLNVMCCGGRRSVAVIDDDDNQQKQQQPQKSLYKMSPRSFYNENSKSSSTNNSKKKKTRSFEHYKELYSVPEQKKSAYEMGAVLDKITSRNASSSISSSGGSEQLQVPSSSSMSEGGKLAQENSEISSQYKEDTQLELPHNWKKSLNPRQELNSSGKYRWIKQIGHGSFGLIVLAEEMQQSGMGKLVVIKFLWREGMVRSQRKNGDIEISNVQREICHHKQLSGHPNIIEFKEIFLLPSFLCIVMEHADGGDMFDYTFKRRLPLSENSARRWFIHLVRAMYHCHSNGIVHRDLKLENCLRTSAPDYDFEAVKLSDGKKWNLKLCDFGYTKHLQKDGVAASRVGSMPYASPEVIYAKPDEAYDGLKRDIWSLGVFLYILLARRYPFDPSTYCLMDLCEHIRTANYRFPSNSGVSEDARNLVAAMLHPDPRQRFSLKQIMKHPWLKKDLPIGWQWSTPIPERTAGWGLQTDEEICSIVKTVFDKQQS